MNIVVQSWGYNPDLIRTLLQTETQAMPVLGPRAQRTQAGCLLGFLPAPLRQSQARERQPGRGKMLRFRKCGVGRRQEGARRMRTQLEGGCTRNRLC